jgi:hypothetical protein
MTGLGFRVKSGYAIAVVLTGRASAPSVVVRRVVQLSDPDAAETRQPYHAGMGKAQEDAGEIARRVKIIERCAKRLLEALMQEDWSARLQPSERIRAGLVVGILIDPGHVANPHIRAHASEGRLFRTVLEAALRSHGIACDVLLEKQLARRAAQDLGRGADISRRLADFGRSLGSPWRSEEKAAATAAWIALAEPL